MKLRVPRIISLKFLSRGFEGVFLDFRERMLGTGGWRGDTWGGEYVLVSQLDDRNEKDSLLREASDGYPLPKLYPEKEL